MDGAISKELGAAEAGNRSKDPTLLAPLQAGLKPHHVEHGPFSVLQSELHNGVGPASGPGIDQAHRFHRTEPQGILAPSRQHFDREAPFEISRLFEGMDRREFRSPDLLPKT